MKQKLKEKYLPTYYRSQLVEQLLNLRQSTSSVSDYLARFEELMLRCEIDEEPFITVSRFVNGLRVDIKREVTLYNPESLEEAYHKALEIEKYLRSPSLRRVTSQAGESRQSRSVSQSASRDSTARNKESISYNPRPSGSSSESRSNGSSIQCHHCHNRGHIAARCPQRALALEHESSDLPESEDQVVDPLEYSGDEDEMGDALEVDDHHVNVVRCILSTAVDSWKAG